jgi:hypothetical protein
MRNTAILLLSMAALTMVGSALQGEDYLTKEGKLAHSLKVTQLQGGFAGFTGVRYTIAPDGAWTSAQVFNRRITPKDKGKLSAKELAKLAAVLRKYNLAKLPAKSGIAPGANPHSIAFEYGKKKATLVGRVPPKLNPKDPTGSVESRFAGIWQEVKGMLKAKPKDR